MQTDLILASYIYLTTTYSFLMALWIFKYGKKCAFSHWGVIESYIPVWEKKVRPDLEAFKHNLK